MARSEFPGQEERFARQQSPSPLSQRNEPYERSLYGSHRWPRQGDANQTRREAAQAQRAARALGWFSIGLGVTELAAAGTVARLAGIDGSRGLVRALGAREIAHGLGILSRRAPTGWVWSRVLGDAIDLAVLGKAAASPHANRLRVAAAVAAVTGVAVLDFKAGQQLSRTAAEAMPDESIHVTKSLQINRPAEELYRFWRDFKNLPRVMEHLESVEVTDDRRSRWTARGPAGKAVEWEAEITEDRPNERIAWRSIEGSTVEHSGSVQFTAAPGRGTFVRVELKYNPPAGLLGAAVAKLFGEEPALQIAEDLRRFKQTMEAGEILTTEGQPAGRAQSTSWKYDHVGRRLAAAF
jgi:uncharacterized membrane protein